MNEDITLHPAKDLIPEGLTSKEEIVSRRTLGSKTFRKPDGKHKIVFSVAPVHYKNNYFNDNEQFKEIDLTPEIVDGKYRFNKNIGDTEVFTDRVGYVYASRLKGRVEVELIEANGVPIDFSKVTVTQNGRQVFYNNVADGLHIQIIIGVGKVTTFKKLDHDNSPRKLKWRVTSEEGTEAFFKTETEGWDDNKNKIELKNSVVNQKSLKANKKNLNSFEFIEEWTGRVSQVTNKHTRKRDWKGIAKYPILIDADVVDTITNTDDDAWGGRAFLGGATVFSSFNTNRVFIWNWWKPSGSYTRMFQRGGLRFQDVQILQGVTIEAANLVVNPRSIWHDPVIRVYGDDVDNAAAWSSGNSPWNITKTTAFGQFSPVTFTNDINVDVKTIIQEIIDRPGWVKGNAMRFAMSLQNDPGALPVASSYTVSGTISDYTNGFINRLEVDVSGLISFTMDGIIRDPAVEKRTIMIAGSAGAISGGGNNTMMGGQDGNPGWTNSVVGLGIAIPVSGKIKRIKIWWDTAPVGGKNRFGLQHYDASTDTYTVYWGGGFVSGNVPIERPFDLEVDPGDVVAIVRDYDGTGGNAVVKWAAEFISTKQKRFILGDGSFTLFGNDNSRRYAPVTAGSWFEATENEQIIEVPVACTLQEMALMISSAPDTGKTWTLSIYKNGAEEVSTRLVIADSAVNATLSGINLSLAVGDTISLSCISSGTPTNNVWGSWGLAFEPVTTDSDSIMGISSKNHLDSTNTYYAPVLSGGSIWSTTEATWKRYWGFIKAFFQDMRIKINNQPGVGKSYAFTFRKNQINTALTATISGTNTQAQDGTNIVTVNDGDELGFSAVPSGSPTTTPAHISYLVTVSTPKNTYIEMMGYVALVTTKTFTMDAIVVESADRIEDDFNDNSLDATKWTNWGGANVTEENHHINVATNTTAAYKGLETLNRYSLIERDVQIEIVNIGNTALASYEAYPLYLALDTDNELQWYISGTSIRARKVVAGVGAFVGGALTYNATDHKFLRIRETGGTAYWDYSADGIHWTNLTSLASPFDLSYIVMGMQAGTWNNEGVATTMILDNFNIEPGTFTMDGYIANRTQFTFTADAYIAARTLFTFTIDAYIALQTNGTFTIDGIIAVTGNPSPFTMDGIIRTGYWFLGGTAIERPSGFLREKIEGKRDVLAISGKTGRDTTGDKEKFTLSWDYLSKDQFDTIKAIVDQNEPTPFFVIDGNLQIASTDVICYLDKALYETSGSDYLVSTKLVLIEET